MWFSLRRLTDNESPVSACLAPFCHVQGIPVKISQPRRSEQPKSPATTHCVVWAHVICRRATTSQQPPKRHLHHASAPHNTLSCCIVLPWVFGALQRHHLVQRPTHGFPHRAALPSRRFSRPQGFVPNLGLQPCFMLLPFLSFINLLLSHLDANFFAPCLSNRRPSLFEDFPLRALRRPHHLHVAAASPLLGLVVCWLIRCSVSEATHLFMSMPCAHLPSFSRRSVETVRACSRRLAQGVDRTCHQTTRSTEFQRT